MERPKFLDYDQSTRGTWSENQVTKAFIELLAYRADSAAYQCAHLLRQGKHELAMSVAGKAEAFEELISDISKQEPPLEEPEPEFLDPVYRFQHRHSNEESTDVGKE